MTLQKGKGKNKEVFRAEICSTCFDVLTQKITSEIDLNQLPQSGAGANNIPVEKKVIADGETLVPSSLDNVAPAPARQSSVCRHEQASFEPPGIVKCRKCGDTWKV